MEKLEKALKDLEKKNKAIEKAIRDIQNKIKEEKPELKINTWYKYPDIEGWMVSLTEIDGKKYNGYGINSHGNWMKDWRGNYDSDEMFDLIELTNEEVEAALISEAKRRGFKEGVKFISASTGKKFTFDYFGKWKKREDVYTLISYGDGSIFEGGKWAEIIQEPKVTINGEVMKQDGDIISFGCAKFHEDFFPRLLNDIRVLNGEKNKHFISHRGFEQDNNRKISSIKLDSGVEITIEQLKEIVDNLK